MSYANDDLVPLLVPPPSTGVGFRQGVVLSWDQQTAENTIEVAGAFLTNVPILNTSEALLLNPGDVVGVMTAGSSWFIMGRITIPGTPAAASALSMVASRIRADEVLGTVSTSSATFQSLGGPVVSDVLISSSGKALLLFGASLNYSTTTSANTEGGQIDVAVSGATALGGSGSANDSFTLNAASTKGVQLTRVALIEELNPGLHTFTHQIAAFSSGRPCNFDRRSLVVFAL